MIRFSLIILSMFFVSCGNVEKPKEENPFQKFVRKFKRIELPYVYRSLNQDFDVSMMTALDKSSIDTMFVSSLKQQDQIYCFGILSDTTNFYSVVYLYPYSSVPILTTYTKGGKIISEEGLMVVGCDGDCGLKYCSSSSIINPDLSIFCADTIKYEYECDSLSNSIPNSAKTIIIYKKGKIDAKGIITMGARQRVETKDTLHQEKN